MFLNISQNSNANTLDLSLLKRDSSAGVFLRIFAIVLRTPLLQNTSGLLLLDCRLALLFFFTTQWTNRSQVFSIFEHVLSRVSNVMSINNSAIGTLYLVKHLLKLTVNNCKTSIFQLSYTLETYIFYEKRHMSLA